MKLDYDLIKEILAEVQDKSDGFTENHINRSEFEDNDEGQKKFFTLAYHYKILFDIGFVEGSICGFSSFDGLDTYAFYYTCLTFQGQKVLEGMGDEETSNKIKDAFIKGGKEGLKQAPALAISVIMKLLGL